MRLIIITFIGLTLSFCTGTNKVDKEVNQRIIEKFNSVDEQLWLNIENAFYSRISELGLLKYDSLQAFYDLMLFVKETGYPDEFYLNSSNSDIIKLREQLNEAGYSTNDEAAHKFLHKIIKPIVSANNYNEEDQFYWYAHYNPDSIPISFSLSAASINTGFNRPDITKQGMYKVLLLFYFSQMLQPQPERKYP
ncbi:hypothetical protein [Reichenbachiella sp.]